MSLSGSTRRLRELLDQASAVLLTGPEDPDGDSLGACLALARGIRSVFSCRVDVAGCPAPRSLWMPGAGSLIPDDEVRGPYDLAIVLDGDRHRLPPAVSRVFHAAGRRAIIDHHGTTSPQGYDAALIDRRSASTCEMVLRVFDAWALAVGRDEAVLLYAGMLFDTGGFRYSNTSSATLRSAARLLDCGIPHADIAVKVLLDRRREGMRLAARILGRATFEVGGKVALGACSRALLRRLGAVEADAEGVVDSLLYVEDVEVAVLLLERGARRVKLSLRSRGLVDVSRLARSLHPSGGGHPKAAGVLLGQPMAEARRRVVALLASELSAAEGVAP